MAGVVYGMRLLFLLGTSKNLNGMEWGWGKGIVLCF